MSSNILRIYLEPVMLEMARAGTFGFVSRVQAAFSARGDVVVLEEDTDAARLTSAALPGYSLFLMKDPFHPRALSMRRAYYYPFWRIEASVKRWEFEVAHKPFKPGELDPVPATKWFNTWRRYLFKRGPLNTEKAGMIYVALQGRLRDHRSFQTMSPLEMIAQVQARAGERRILLGLHPGETYTPAEIAAVEAVAEKDPRITLQTGGMEEALRLCDFTVTQNSTAALSGFFFRKPAILFAKTDFHHAMAQVARLGVDEAWHRVENANPPYARYMHWFLQMNAIKADEADAEKKIVETCRKHGWPV